MAERSRTVEIDDWDAVVAELERFCTNGTFHAESDVASCTVGDATIEIHATGRIESDTRRHEFDGKVDTLEFDHRVGAITAESEERATRSAGRELTACVPLRGRATADR